MSRYLIAASNPHKHICFVGYDPPLQTYFAQVVARETFDPEELRANKPEELMFDDDNLVLWSGTNPFEMTWISDLRLRLAGYAEVPEEVCAKLEQDREQSPALTPLQRQAQRLINEWSHARDADEQR